MDLKNLMNAIGVKLTPFELADGVTVYIRLPSIKEHAECHDPFKAIYLCVVDENCDRIFDSAEQVEQKVDLTIQIKLNTEVGRVFAAAFNADDVEAK